MKNHICFDIKILLFCYTELFILRRLIKSKNGHNNPASLMNH